MRVGNEMVDDASLKVGMGKAVGRARVYLSRVW